MKISEIITTETGALLLRPRAEAHTKGQPYQYEIKPLFTGQRRGWTILDAFTISALKAVYNALKPEAQAKYDTLPLMTLINFTWKHIN